MKCKRELWTKALALVKHAIDSKSTMPILAQVVITAANGRLVIDGTDLTRQMLIHFPCDGDLDFHSFDLKTLAQISNAAKKKKGELIEITPTKTGIKLLIAGRTFELDQEGREHDRPKDRVGVGTPFGVRWDAAPLYRALDYVLPAVCRDETRFHMCAVRMVDGKLIATDGHRMHIAEGIDSPSLEGVSVDLGTAVALKSAIKQTGAADVQGSHYVDGTGLLEFSVEGSELKVLIRSKPVESGFPPYEVVLPRNTEHYSVDCDLFRESMQTALKIIKAKGFDPFKGVELHANGDLRLISSAGFREVLELSEPAGLEHHAGVNPVYMIDALRGAAGDCRIEYSTGDLDPIGIRTNDDFYAVVMPLRIK